VILSCADDSGKWAAHDCLCPVASGVIRSRFDPLRARILDRSPTIAAIRDERILATSLGRIRESFAGHDDLVRDLEAFVRTAEDRELVRIDPLPFASGHGIAEDDAIDLFLHGRKAGLFTMEWQCVCPGCGEIAQSFQSLRATNARYFCKVCIAERDADLSGFIEITFTLSPAVRPSRYHDPASLDAESHALDYRFTANGIVDGGPSLREFYRKNAVLTAWVEPGETKSFPLRIAPGFLFFTSGPIVEVRDGLGGPNPPVAFTHDDDRSDAAKHTVAPGRLDFVFTNPTSKRVPLLGINVPGHYEIVLARYLSGTRLLSHQTFIELFPSETIVSAEGLGVTEIALLFTDITGSTALYERIGDVKAFQLVQQHFGLLRDVIARHSGALVKTIGDAVMASFHRPLDALSASLEMRTAIARFNESAGEEMIALKMGVHTGGCLAVTLNGRLDYFGQAVNLAARIQGVAAANEICISDELYRVAGAAELLAGFQRDSTPVRVKGVERELVVHRITSHR
jgi:class 3 adenylate cyclase